MNKSRYENKTYVGSGGMASVYKAFDVTLQRDVAIKVMADQLRNNESVRDLFTSEARKMASINHQNVVHVYDVSDDDDVPTIYMEYMRGGNLASLMGSGPMAGEEVLKIMRQVILGLGAIHGQGLVHRDVKPENILEDSGTYKITDFGVAMSGDEDALPFVTSKYAAPEVLIEPEKIGPSSDIYSLGIMAIELLLGPRRLEEVIRETMERDEQLQIPAIKDSVQAFWQHWVASQAELPDLFTLDSAVSVELSELLANMTKRDQSARLQDCGTLLTELDRVIEASDQRAGATTDYNPKMKRKLDKLQAERDGAVDAGKKKKPLWMKAVIGLGGLLVAAILALFLIPSGPDTYHVDLVTEPPGATVTADGALFEGYPTPTWFDGSWGSTVTFELDGYDPIEVVLAEGMEGLTQTDEGFELSVAWPDPFSIENSVEAADYFTANLPSAWPVEFSLDNGSEQTPQRIALETPISFRVSSEKSGSLTLLHLGSDNYLTLVYPNPAGVAPKLAAREPSNIGAEIGLTAKLPLGTEWFVLLVSEEPLIPTNLGEMQKVEDWATLFPIAGSGSPGETLAVWLTDAGIADKSSGRLLEIEIVQQEGN